MSVRYGNYAIPWTDVLPSFGLSFELSFYLLFQSWNFVDLSSAPFPRALFPYRFPYVSLMVT